MGRFDDKNTPETALDDPMDVLRLLYARGHRTGACLRTPPGQPAFVEREYMGGAYDMQVQGRDTWYVTRKAIMHLEDNGWLNAGREHWGWTDRNERYLTPRGEEALWDRVGQVNRLETVLRFFSGHPEPEPE